MLDPDFRNMPNCLQSSRFRDNRSYTIVTECISAAMWSNIVPNTEPEGAYVGTIWNNFLETKILMQLKYNLLL